MIKYARMVPLIPLSDGIEKPATGRKDLRDA